MPEFDLDTVLVKGRTVKETQEMLTKCSSEIFKLTETLGRGLHPIAPIAVLTQVLNTWLEAAELAEADEVGKVNVEIQKQFLRQLNTKYKHFIFLI